MINTQEDRYLIRKGGVFYRPNAQGYTASKSEAGRYTLAEAIAHSHPNGHDGPRDGIDYMLADEPAALSHPCKSGEGAGKLDLCARVREFKSLWLESKGAHWGDAIDWNTAAEIAFRLSNTLTPDATQTREAEGQAFLDAFDAAQEDGGHVLWKAVTDAADTYRAALNARGGA